MSLLNEDKIYEETRKATRPPMTYTAFKNLLSIVKKTPESTQNEINIKKYIDTKKSDGITVNNKGDISFHGKKGLELMNKLKEENLPITNIFKERENKNMGGILQDERLKYEHGGPHADTRTEDEKQMDYLESAYKRAIETGQKEDAQNVADQIDKLQTKMIEEAAKRFPNYGGGYQMRRKPYAEGSLLDDDMMAIVVEEEMPTHTMPDGTVMPGATHGEDEMMEPEEMEMAPDEEMESDYLDFIIDEALTEEEEDMLMSKLEQDEQMAMLFDKVIDVAQEFAGSGPVEGPGSGVSDSIPARLSDGEFVFTAKAVEEIGADNLMAMMKDAEMKADERQGLAEGGEPEEEETVVMPVEQPSVQQDIRVTKTTVGPQASMQEEQDLIGDEVKKSMLRQSRNLG